MQVEIEFNILKIFRLEILALRINALHVRVVERW
jgi:hypothetical protein